MDPTVVIAAGALVAAYMAWTIGANDVANAMGTSVGSKAITVRQAILIACFANFFGALLVGGHVTGTIQTGLIQGDSSVIEPANMAAGMLGSLLAAAIWVTTATYFKLPVSTTHAIVGGVVGCLLLVGGPSIVKWAKVGEVVASWVVTPAMSGLFAYFLFTIIRARIIRTDDPIGATRRYGPVAIGLVFFVLSLVILYKGLKNLQLDLDAPQALILSSIIACMAGLFGWMLIRRAPTHRVDERTLEKARQSRERERIAEGLERAEKGLASAASASVDDLKDEIDEIRERVGDLVGSLGPVERARSREPRYFAVERVFAGLQLVSATCVAFAQGANDVANAIGPFASIRQQFVNPDAPATLPVWVLLMGGAMIAVGIATWGWRVMRTVGHEITALTPTRGYAAEFACATTVLLASRLGLPVSTTHCLVGAVLGVGMARGVESLNWKVMRLIVASWVITLPVAAVLAVILAVACRALLFA